MVYNRVAHSFACCWGNMLAAVLAAVVRAVAVCAAVDARQNYLLCNCYVDGCDRY